MRVAPERILYSSCNATSLAKDLEALSGYTLKRVQLFDMFPHTAHYEVLVELVRE
jgi:23S rRNA (uracil747-C5)-methyltransferase